MHKRIILKIKKMISSINDKWKQEELIKRMTKNVMILFLGDFGSSLLGILSMLITIKLLGLEKYGWLVLIQTYALIVDNMINFQSWTAMIKYGAEAVSCKDEIHFKNCVLQGFLLDVVTAIIGALIGYMLAGLVGNFLDWDAKIISAARLYSIVILSHVSGTSIGVLRLLGKFKLFAIQQFSIAVFKFILISIAFVFKADFNGVLIISLIIDILSNFSLLIISLYVLKNRGLFRTKGNHFKIDYGFMKFSILNNLTTTIDIPVKQLDVFIISSVLTIELVSVYKIFKNITNVFSKVTNKIFQVIYPELSYFTAEGDNESAIGITLKVTKLMLYIGMPIALIMSMTSKYWLSVLFDDLVSTYWLTFSVFLLFKIISTSFITIHPLFLSLGYVKQNLFIIACSNLIYLVLAWTMGSFFGLIGLVLTFGIQFLIVICLKIYIINSSIKLRKR